MREYIFKSIITAVFALFIWTSCTVNEEGVMGSFPYLEVETETVNLSKIGSSDAIAVKSNRPVKVSVASQFSWIRAEVSGEQLVLDWDDNDVETTREAIITLSTSNDLVCKDIRVIQDASGELTINGDLVLRSKEEIASNTYTKTLGNLIVGAVTSITTKAAEASVKTEFGKKIITAAPSDINDRDLVSLTDQIHKVEEGGLAIVNTKVTSLPLELIAGNKIDKVYSEYNSISVLDSGQDLAELKLKELSLKGNNIADISPLAACTTIEYLDISGNDVYDVEPLQSMSGLKKLVLNDLPLTASQLDVLRDVIDVEIVADELRSEDSPLPVFGETEIVEVSDTEVQLKVKLVGNTTGVTKTGFYIGLSRNINEMTYYEAPYSGGNITMTYNPKTLYNCLYYVRAAAKNAKGIAYSELETFGSIVYEGDMYIGSNTELSAFQNKAYSHINGSLLIGDVSGSSSNGVHLNDGKFDKYFKKYEFSDLLALKQLVSVRDGLYMGNIGLEDLNVISHVKDMQTLWLKGNNITVVPELRAFSELKSLDVSMNKISDYTFLDKIPVLERLSLGSSGQASKETNEIFSLNGLAKYKNLKYIDLSGLPVHEWQVEDLRKLMPQAEIVFVSGGRDPFIPTVVSKGVTPKESEMVLKGVISSTGRGDISEYGFYVGKDKSKLQKITLGTSIKSGSEFTYEFPVTDEAKYYFYPYAINTFGESRTDINDFSLSAANLSKYGTSNCYIVSLPGEYYFDATVIGNGYEGIISGTKFHTEDPVIAPESAGILWVDRNYDVIKDVKYENGRIYFVVTGLEGNALIGARNSSGRVIWSWHIWVTDQPKNQLYVNSTGNYVVQDRNIGATQAERGAGDTWKESMGMVYFWGRKDPFFSANAYTKGEKSLTIEESIAYPTMTHGTTSWTGGSSSWMKSPNQNRWSSSQKTIYDPCPVGYRVASEDIWRDFTTTNTSSTKVDAYNIKGGFDFGFNFYINPEKTETAWYPLTHYITWTGNYVEVSTESYCWTSAYTSNTDKKYSGFYYEGELDTKVLISEKKSDGHAFSVRCMSEDNASFIVVTENVSKAGNAEVAVTGNVSSSSSCQITEKGVIWSNKTVMPSINVNDGKLVSPNTGSGRYTCKINDINNRYKYYIRTYAIGDGVISYGNVIEYVPEPGGSGEGFTGDDFIL